MNLAYDRWEQKKQARLEVFPFVGEHAGSDLPRCRRQAIVEPDLAQKECLPFRFVVKRPGNLDFHSLALDGHDKGGIATQRIVPPLDEDQFMFFEFKRLHTIRLNG